MWSKKVRVIIADRVWACSFVVNKVRCVRFKKVCKLECVCARNTPGSICQYKEDDMVLCQGLPRCLRLCVDPCMARHAQSLSLDMLDRKIWKLLDHAETGEKGQMWSVLLLYVPTCIHLFPHARTDTIQVVEHEPNFSKFYTLTISFLVSQFCTLESSLCVSSSDYYLIFPFGSSLIKVVLDPKIRTTECTHQTTSVHRMNSWLITM